jgi:hypothetical protein
MTFERAHALSPARAAKNVEEEDVFVPLSTTNPSGGRIEENAEQRGMDSPSGPSYEAAVHSSPAVQIHREDFIGVSAPVGHLTYLVLGGRGGG